jgi:hypothetical protein
MAQPRAPLSVLSVFRPLAGALTAVLLLGLAQLGCATQVVAARAAEEPAPLMLSRAEQPEPGRGPDGVVAWYAVRLREAFAAAEVPTKKLCPSGFWTVKDGELLVDQLVGAYGGTVWYDSRVGIQCGGQSLQITLTPEQLRRIASHPSMLEEVGRFSPRRAGQLAEALEIHGVSPATRSSQRASTAPTPTF